MRKTRSAAQGEKSPDSSGMGTVGPKGEGCKTGRWVCLKHCEEQLWNQFQKDIHIGTRGAHVLAWWCSEHGHLEVP